MEIFEQYDIVKFLGNNNFIETGIIKEVNNKDQLFTIQTLDKKSLRYFGNIKILEKIGKNILFDFSDEAFHTFEKNTKFKLFFTEKFVKDYTDFYNSNFGNGYLEQLNDFKNIWNCELGNEYDIEIFEYDGRFSYCCILNNVQSIYTFIISEELIQNHAKQQYN